MAGLGGVQVQTSVKKVSVAYQQTKVNTASPAELTLMLFNGAVRFTMQAIAAVEARRLDAAHHDLVRAQDIVTELQSSLNMSYPIAQNLYQLYVYIGDRLVEANVRKDPEPAQVALQLLQELRDTWAEVVQSGAARPRPAHDMGRSAGWVVE